MKSANSTTGIYTGTVKSFDDAKGYGFILPTEGGRDIFVHHTGIRQAGFRSLTHGQFVEYEVGEGKYGLPIAINVQVRQP